jgi:heme a synthase
MAAAKPIGVPAEDHRRAIRLWLYAVAALVFAMVLVGGATRLTESGLSITQWRPVMGVVPPLTHAQWQAEFQRYQEIPQYQALNTGMSLDAFKSIFWWEWTHRLLGRLIGVAFLMPFLFFLWRGWIGPGLRGRLALIFGLGALQGAVGWWMVASGLADRIEVSQYRLATHLVLACVIYVAMIWTAAQLGSSERPMPAGRAGEGGDLPARLRFGATGLLILVLGQIYLGALVAGLRAGYIYNTWPSIDGGFVPHAARLFSASPLWRNFFENTLTVQFDHRMLAYTIWICAVLHLIDAARNGGKSPALTGALVVAGAVTLQAALGIWTLLEVAPLSLSLAHQAMAMLVLTAATLHAARSAASAPRRAIAYRPALSQR